MFCVPENHSVAAMLPSLRWKRWKITCDLPRLPRAKGNQKKLAGRAPRRVLHIEYAVQMASTPDREDTERMGAFLAEQWFERLDQP